MQKKFQTICVPFSVRRYDGKLYVIIHVGKNIHATAVAVIMAVGTAFVSLEYLSVMIITCWLLFNVLDSGPKIFIAAISNGSIPEKDVDCACA